MVKPIGPICNLRCRYCYYLEKEALYPAGERYRMSDALLERYVREYLACQDGPEVTFSWQGGEPMLLGLDFFRRAVELQQRYAGGRRVANALQTNGTLLDDAWCEFFTQHDFLIGLSIDGPQDLHDLYRVDRKGRGSFDRVMRGLQFLRKHGTQFNTLTVLNRENARQPQRVYRFLKDAGARFLQFIPLVERCADGESKELGLDLALPPDREDKEEELSPVTDWSVRPRAYGNFLIAMFDEWVRRDVGSVFVQIFDTALAAWAGAGAGLCVFAETCGTAMVLEHNGDLFACDHFVYPKYRLGSICHSSLREMAGSARQTQFGNDKRDALPKQCRTCDVLFACRGACPKHRFLCTPDGEPGLNYLCAGFRRFFHHATPYMEAMARLLRAGRPPAEIMRGLAARDREARWESVRRNDPCPCGSGRKYKACCASRREKIRSGARSE
jgi:uncharacterized protein